MKLTHSFILSALLATSSMATTIKSINFDAGLIHISDAVAKRMVGFKVGDELDIKKVDEAIKNFYSQGYFKDIWVDEVDGHVTFNFVEKPVISKIIVKGYEADEDVNVEKSVLGLEKGFMYDKEKVESARKRLVDVMSAKGLIDSVVEVQVDQLEGGSVVVTFIANEGEEIIIEKLQYSGVSGDSVDSDDFDDVIANKEHQFMGWMWGRNDGVMKLDQLQYDPMRIRDYYMRYGYLDAMVKEPFVRVDFDNYKAAMSYQVSEGEVYRTSNISILQEKPIVKEEKILELIDLELNKPFNIQQFRDDAEKIKTIFADLGYAFVEVTPNLKKDKESGTVDVSYYISPGEIVHINNVTITGNTRTLDRVVRRELYLAPGDKYSLTNLNDSRGALGRSGFFESSTIEEKRLSETSMDLVVKVKEAATGNIQIGGGYGSYGGLMLNVGVNDRNVFGSGINMGVQAEKSERTMSASFNIANPRLNDSDFSGNFSIFASNFEYNDYTVSTKGTGVGVGHRFTRYISGYVGYSYSDNSYSNYSEEYIANPRYTRFLQDYDKSAVTTTISWDSTDDYYLPRKGWTGTQSIEFAGIGGKAEFTKFRTTFAKYYGFKKLLGFDMIGRYKARFYDAIDQGFLPLAERFYMGGYGSVRGYESYSISPVIVESDGYETRIGGTQTFSNNIEANFPFIPSAKMRLTTFLDWGFIGDKSLTEYSRGGYGLGLEWFSPMGPIQLIFARPLNEQPGDKTAFFEFTMGQRF